ncbi:MULTISPECIES: MBL fold metallo-hydrolase [Actinomycetes]|uniref:MBL fold metallo-hydrolase n=1 Tax=Actinomycetes TaxID=1760 RepID=UPI0001B55BA8|nr:MULTISPECIES: MBL fold metallo-hydrolase [Actinomycetes]EFL10710.1 beta-lactamase [Streptomyces sp. AA4]
MTATITLGSVTATRVLEYEGTTRPPEAMFPGLAEGTWQEHESRLPADSWDRESGLLRTCVQTWVLRSGGATILVDTGAGDGKDRPGTPAFHQLRTGFLDRLAAAGVAPEDVDFVVNTHLHSDHVGWNTRLDNGEWRPTFPNATYLLPRADHDFWNPAGPHRPKHARANENVFADSIAPVVHSGQARLWEDHYDIDEALRLEPAPGHTPGSSVLTVRSGTDRALFVGDLLHHPLQFAEPDLNSCFCEDPTLAAATRHKLLGQAADERALVFPAHIGSAPAVEIVRDGAKFTVTRWGIDG